MNSNQTLQQSQNAGVASPQQNGTVIPPLVLGSNSPRVSPVDVCFFSLSHLRSDVAAGCDEGSCRERKQL
jgi:hypothetical protein